jgi:membrane protease YdiL (CAAX protease family)
VLVSIESLFSPPSAHDISSAKWEFSLIRQSGGLLLVWFLLKKRSKYFFDLGLSWSWMDAGWSVLLYFAATIAYYALFAPLSLGAQVLGLGDTPDVMKHSVPSEGGVAVLIFLSAMILNPFFEELIVRAYLMTTVKELTKSTIIIPILVSTLLQTSYHFYQGVPRALSEGAGFFIFSCFYAKTNRIAPLILAHLYMDLWAPFSYWMQSH